MKIHVDTNLDPVIEGSWRLVVKGWGDLLDGWYTHGDRTPYAHGKLAGVGLLGAAIARSHPDNLVFPDYRVRLDKQSFKVDLRAVLDERPYLIQARYREVSCRTEKSLFRHAAYDIRTSMQRLLLVKDQGVYRAAAVLVVPYVRNEDPAEYIRLRTRVESDALPESSSQFPILRADYYPDRPIEAEGKQALGVSLFVGFHSSTQVQV